MILGIGLDLCDVPRMEKALTDERFLERYFAPVERAYILGRGKGAAQSMAGHFAAKEAGLKALGCGVAVPLHEIYVTHDEKGAPRLTLEGKALAAMEAMGGKCMRLSITHTETTAAAVAILEG